MNPPSESRPSQKIETATATATIKIHQPTAQTAKSARIKINVIKPVMENKENIENIETTQKIPIDSTITLKLPIKT